MSASPGRPWTWVPPAAVIVIHDRQIARHGGAPGLRDRALLEMGCARPINRAAHDPGADVFALAAATAWGLTRAHAFVDGNKRTGFVAMATFLRLNGQAFRPDPGPAVRMMEDLAAGAADEEAFARWLEAGARPL